MTTPQSQNGTNGTQPPGADAFPFPKALWAAMKRDPEAVTALFWAVDRLLRRKGTPYLCYPGSSDCPYCHPDHQQLITVN